MKNIEKWDIYEQTLDGKTKDFIKSLTKGLNIPKKYYFVYPTGKIVERAIIDFDYSHYKHGAKTYFQGKNPTNKDIEQLSLYVESDIPFTANNLWFKYSEKCGDNRSSTSSVAFLDVMAEKGLFYCEKDATEQSEIFRKKDDELKSFREEHKKDSGYDYRGNGYKFLGWQNGWKHTYFDEDGNNSEASKKPRRSFGYTKEDYPEYGKCIEEGHRRIEVSHNSRGSEHTVSCPACKIYWKYDSSD